jgi:branched-chain amino acid transport system substrate-binding protein
MTKTIFRRAGLALLAWATLSMSLASSAQDIVVGQIGPFTVLPSPDAKEVNEGALAYFEQINAAGGVNGRKITVFTLDDKFNGDEFVKQLDVAIARNPVALITPIGSAALQKLVNDKLLDKRDTVIVNAIPGADSFRNPGHPRLFHVRASDRNQISKIVSHASTLSLKSMMVFHQDLPIGTGGLAVAKEVGDKAGIKISGLMSKHDDAALAQVAPQVAAARNDAVLVIGSPKFMADAIAQLRKANTLSSVYALSYLSAGLLTKVVGDAQAKGVGIAQAFPSPTARVSELQRAFQNTMAKHAPNVKNITHFHFEGYISARVLVEGLKRSGNNPTPAKLAEALRRMGPLDMRGFIVDFSKGNSGSQFVDIAVVSNGKLLY